MRKKFRKLLEDKGYNVLNIEWSGKTWEFGGWAIAISESKDTMGNFPSFVVAYNSTGVIEEISKLTPSQ